jgi:hypothetical protein
MDQADNQTMDTLYCFEAGCKFERKEKKNNKEIYNMTQCTSCLAWYHDDCVGIDSKTPLTFWPCPTCRLMSFNVNKLIP